MSKYRCVASLLWTEGELKLKRERISRRFSFPSLYSLRKQPPFGDATGGFSTKQRMKSKRRNSILMTCHYPNLSSAYADLQPMRSIYAFSNNPKKHSHHVDIRNKNNDAKNCAVIHLKTISTTQIWVARVARQH